jgi:hypothetical protein
VEYGRSETRWPVHRLRISETRKLAQVETVGRNKEDNPSNIITYRLVEAALCSWGGLMWRKLTGFSFAVRLWIDGGVTRTVTRRRTGGARKPEIVNGFSPVARAFLSAMASRWLGWLIEIGHRGIGVYVVLSLAFRR